jgi:hypothetical protein
MNRQSLADIAGRLAVLVAVLHGAGSPAQQTQPVPTSMPTMPFADYTFGFEMRVPAGWDYDRTRFAGPAGAVGLLRGRALSERATLQILVFPKPETVAFADWIRYYDEQLTRISGTLKISGEQRRVGTRTASVLEVDAHVGGDRTKTYYLCVPFDPTQVWVLSYAVVVASADGAGLARQRFDELVESLRVLYDPEQARAMTAAFERGKVLIARLATESANVRVPDELRYYDITVKGKSIGYLVRQVLQERRSLDDPRFGKKGKPGIRIRERSWRFAQDGAVRYSQVDLFGSSDLRTELVETRYTQVPGSAGVPASANTESQRIFTTLDQCVREGDLLFSSYSTSLDVGLPHPREPIQVGDTYLSLAWVRLLPAVLGGQPGPKYAFAVYDPETRALSTSTIRPLGPRPLPGEADTRARAFETSVGFAEQPGLLYADPTGLLLRYQAGDLVLRLTSEEAVQLRWGARRDAARKRMEGRR